jgi:hypothetical protein
MISDGTRTLGSETPVLDIAEVVAMKIRNQE